MKPFFLIASLVLVQQAMARQPSAPAYQPKEGDFVFQSLPHGDLVDAIEGASNSPYSHVGLVLRKQGAWYVREAIGEVIDTPLPEWIDRGRGHAFDAYRLKAPFQKHIPAFIQASQAFVGRPYDYQYDMDDAKIYCSELLYKAMFKASGIRLGQTQKLGELRWQPYKQTIESYENGPVPLGREMITPKALSQAPELFKPHSGIP